MPYHYVCSSKHTNLNPGTAPFIADPGTAPFIADPGTAPFIADSSTAPYKAALSPPTQVSIYVAPKTIYDTHVVMRTNSHFLFVVYAYCFALSNYKCFVFAFIRITRLSAFYIDHPYLFVFRM